MSLTKDCSIPFHDGLLFGMLSERGDCSKSPEMNCHRAFLAEMPSVQAQNSNYTSLLQKHQFCDGQKVDTPELCNVLCCVTTLNWFCLAEREQLSRLQSTLDVKRRESSVITYEGLCGESAPEKEA